MNKPTFTLGNSLIIFASLVMFISVMSLNFSYSNIQSFTTVDLTEYTQLPAEINKPVTWINDDTQQTVETEPPEVVETDTSEVDGKLQKRVIVSSDIQYENILTYASVPDLFPEQVKLYWMIDGVKTEVTEREDFDVTFYDENSDNLIDKISWITPHLSEQEFILEFDITVINPWEYGETGGEWIVYFNTTGTGTLNITKDELSNQVLTFNYIKCGENTIYPSIGEYSYLIENYSCSEIAEISHTINEMPSEIFSLQFDFGNDINNDVDFAYDPDPNADSDGDGLLNADEDINGWNGEDPGSPDARGGCPFIMNFGLDQDGDCLSDNYENSICTSFLSADTDGDDTPSTACNDYQELADLDPSTDPCTPLDCPAGGGNNAPVWTQAITDPVTIYANNGTNTVDTSMIVSGNGQCTDADGDTLSFLITSEDSTKVDCILSGTGGIALSVTPKAQFKGNATCTIRCTDLTDTVDDTFTINVVGQQLSCGSKPTTNVTLGADMVCSGSNWVELDTKNNLDFDCDGHSLIETGTASGSSAIDLNPGSYAARLNNISIHNCIIRMPNITYAYAIKSQYVNNLSIYNNSITVNHGAIYYQGKTNHSKIYNNTIRANKSLVNLLGGYWNNLSHNNMFYMNQSDASSVNTYIGGDHMIIDNNTINASSATNNLVRKRGIRGDGYTNMTYTNNTFIVGMYAFEAIKWFNSTFQDNWFESLAGRAAVLYTIQNNTFQNNTWRANSGQYRIKLQAYGSYGPVYNNTFINEKFIINGTSLSEETDGCCNPDPSWPASAYSDNIIYSNSFGKINFSVASFNLRVKSGTAAGTSYEDFSKISNNSIFFNFTSHNYNAANTYELNQSEHSVIITIYNTNNWYTDRTPYKSGTKMTSGFTEISDADTYVFSVSLPIDGYFNFSVGEGANSPPSWTTQIPTHTMNADNATAEIDEELHDSPGGVCADSDGDTLTFSVHTESTSQVDCLTSGTNGESLRVTPAANWSGTATCVIKCEDPSGRTANESFFIIVEKTIAMSISTNLADDLDWAITNTTGYTFDASENNGASATGYYVTIEAHGGEPEVTIKSSADLTKGSGTDIGLANYTYKNSTTNTAPGSSTAMTTSYVAAASDLDAGSSQNVYFKFFLNVSSAVSAGTYTTTTYFRGNV